MTETGIPDWLPTLTDLYDKVSEEPEPDSTSHPASQRIKQAINELAASGAPVTNPTNLLRFILTATAAVQRGESGFDLSYKDTESTPESTEDSEVVHPPDRLHDETIRVFYGGVVTDPRNPGNAKSAVKSRPIAERLAAECTATGNQAVTLERLGHAAIIDRLDLWRRDTRYELRKPFQRVMREFPEWNERVRGATGTPDMEKFARIVWTEGLSAQYGSQAEEEGIVVNTMPFEGQTWVQHERPAAFANGRSDPEKFYNLGFTHEPLSIADGGLGKRSQPLPEYTGPMTEAQAMKFIESSIAEQKTRPRKPGKLTNPPIPSTHGALNPITASELADHVKTTQANTKRAAKHPPVNTTPDQSQTTTRKPHQHPENNDPKPETHSPRP